MKRGQLVPIAIGAAALVAVGVFALSGDEAPKRKPAPKPRPNKPPPNLDLAPADDGPPQLGTSGYACCASQPLGEELVAKAFEVLGRLNAGALTLGMVVPFTSGGQRFGALTTLHPKGGGGQGLQHAVEIWMKG